ncbi:MAG: sigma-70 family RNA polymerase sigma factor, partial [Thermoleophilaceae bacterium]|nr:sigma-70 family RNA polymerase sigma factor [Thermoleophilaceae bacterium]
MTEGAEGGGPGVRRATRPGDAINPAAVRLIERHGDALFATARRYTLSREDAEDAYQRGLEILLTKAPALPEQELLPWMRTVVKHEAFAIWRSQDRTVTPPVEEWERAPAPTPPPDEQVESYERLRVGAEAIRRLKPQEVRCLALRAEGHSYRQICQITGWTYTKVNRCLTEGRRSFLERVAGIESGAECERLGPLLSAFADGEATAVQMTKLRPHLRSCLSCRAALRAFRELPH